MLLLIGLISGIFLARLLTPSDFGTYVIVSFLVLKLSALAELGLNTRLIHDHAPPTGRNQRSVFTLHFLLAVVTYLLLYFAAAWLAPLFRLGSDTITFCRVLALLMLLQPLRTIPIAHLSRDSRYDLLAVAELTDGVVYQITALILAFAGFSYWSFGVAALLSTAVGTLLLNTFSPWRIGFAWDPEYLRGCVRFGGTFQLSSLTAIARDNIITFLAGPLFGPTAVGYLNWALRLAWTCTQAYAGMCSRVGFPSLSRMRSEPALFGAAITKMARYVNFVTLLTLSVVAALAPEVVHIVFTDKWAAAVPLFYCFAIRMIAGNYTTLLDSALKAQGYPERSLKILSLWTLWEWAMALLGAAMFGYAGIAISGAIAIWFALAWLYRDVSRLVPVNLWHASATPFFCGALTFLTLSWAKGHRITGLPELLIAMLAGALLYVVAAFLAEGPRFWTAIRADISLVLQNRAMPSAPQQ